MGLTKEQQAFRRTGIGGSDAAVVLGISPWKSRLELWLEKTGFQAPKAGDDIWVPGVGFVPDPERQRRFDVGHHMEPLIESRVAAGAFKSHGDGKHLERLAGGKQHIYPGIAAWHHEHGFMIANTDRSIGGTWVERGDRKTFQPSGVLEMKTAEQRAFKASWRHGVPLYYQAQVQHYMAVTGARWAVVACMEGLGEVHCWELQRDDKWINERLIPACVEFWRLVTEKEMPDTDGSDSCARALSLMFPAPEKGKRIELGEKAVDVHVDAVEYVGLGKVIAEAKEQRSKLANRLLDTLGDAQEAELTDGAVLRRVGNKRQFTIKKAKKEKAA